jgi:hypothetical protein
MRPGTRWDDVVYGATLLVFLAVYIQVHRLAGLGFPVPWPDEGSFLWQAIAVQEGNTLFAPQLNPQRHVMWMPPGYMILSGWVFKLTGFSLSWARTLSALYVMGGTVILARILSRYRFPYLYLLLCGCFLLSRDFVFTGNLARMEGMVFLMAMGGFALLQRGHRVAALALLAFTPLVHPGGLYFLAGAAVYVAVRLWKRGVRERPSIVSVVAALACFAAWSAYAIYIALHWTDFVNDMDFQTSWRRAFPEHAADFWDGLLSRDALLLLVLGAIGVGYGVWKRVSATFLLVLAIPLGLLNLTTSGTMYEIYASLAVLLAAVILLEMGLRLADDAARGRSRAWSVSLAAPVFLSALAVIQLSGRLENPRGYPHRMTFDGMRMPAKVAYIDDGDEAAVRRFLRSLDSAGSRVRVQFLPWADALLFRDQESENVRFVQPTFHDAKADVHIVHLSRTMPKRLVHTIRLRIHFGSEIREKLESWPVLRRRQHTEVWMFHPAGVGDS